MLETGFGSKSLVRLKKLHSSAFVLMKQLIVLVDKANVIREVFVDLLLAIMES